MSAARSVSSPARILVACLHGCSPVTLDVSDSADSGTAGSTGPITDGSTVVVVLNPVVNTLHAGGVPGELGEDRDAVVIRLEPGPGVVTVDGLAVVEAPVGSVELQVGPAVLSLDVTAGADVIDAPIAFDGDAAAYFANTPLRYPTGAADESMRFDPDAPVARITAALGKDEVVVVLRPGIYRGDLVVRGHDALVFGEGWTDHAVVIEGSMIVEGDDVRVRGVTITGDLTATGAKFGMSFSRVLGATSIADAGGAFVRNAFCGTVELQESGGIMLDNFGLPPIAEPPTSACAL